MPERKLRTNISQPHCWTSNGTFEALQVQGGRHEAWLDALLKGGLSLPQRDDKDRTGSARALSILLAGPAGAGKSTFALELCHRARYEDGTRPLCLYVTSESNLSAVQQQVESLGWKDFEPVAPDGLKSRPGGVEVAETNDFIHFLDREAHAGLWAVLKKWAVATDVETTISALDATAAGLLQAKVKERCEALISSEQPQILIIDSLNTAPAEKQPLLYAAFSEMTRLSGLDAVILILDAETRNSAADFWSFASDMVIRLDRSSEHSYMIRTLEIVKARYQEHVWGPHQLKIYGSNRPDKSPELLRLQHPYRQEGGIFIYPSIHYHLSRGKRREATAMDPVPCPIATLDEAMGGFPLGRCAGLVGSRGGHKSHLGYTHILAQCERNEFGLIVSLRDDPGMARGTMAKILRALRRSGSQKAIDEHQVLREAQRRIESLERDGKLEVMYFPPGYITPDEFFHRVYVAVQRVKGPNPGAPITLMFNSLDQLGSRFPLCAKEKIFVPGLIEMLSAERVTSIFIGVTNEGGQPHDQYGLLSMADTLLSVEREGEQVYMALERLSGGRQGGARGVLGLNNDLLTWCPVAADRHSDVAPKQAHR